MANSTLENIEGQVKWFDPRKGFGFIVGPEGQDIFVHFSVIDQEGGFRTSPLPGPIRSHPEGVSAAGLQPSSLSNPLMSCAKAAMPSVIDQIPSSRRALIAMLRSVARIWTPLLSR